MIYLSPSILSADFMNLQRDIEAVVTAGCDYIHFDVMDGIFVPSISYGMPVMKCIKEASDVKLDVHLMITDPQRYVKEFAELGADIITFHYEATSNAREIINLIHRLGKKAGIAIKPGTPAGVLKQFLLDIDLILVMTVEPGFGGQKYNDECTEKIIEVADWIKESGREIMLEVDGGIKESNLKMVIESGANDIVAGSCIFKGDIIKNMKRFKSIMGECESN